MKRWNSIAAAGMLLPPSLVIAFYMYVGIFNRMLGDDYCSLYIGERLGLLRSVWYWYISWHGGFSVSMVDWFISLLGQRSFPFYAFIFLSAWLIFAILAVKKVLRFRGYSPVGIFPALLLGVFLIFATLSISPDVSQSLFWWGGVRSYLSPLVLTILYFALYFHFISLSFNRVQIGIWLVASFGLVCFIGGFSETFTPVLVVLLAGIVAIKWLASGFSLKGPSFLFLGAGFAGALFALFAMVLAPGNSIRQAYFPAPPGVFTLLRIAFASYLTFLFGIFSSPYILAGLLGSIFGSVWLGMRINRESSVTALPGWWTLGFLCAGFILAFGCFIPAVYGTSEPPPGRTLITPAFILAICFLISSFVFGEWLSYRRTSVSLLSVLPLVACSLILFSSWGAFQKLNAMRAEHVAFAQKWDQVDFEIRDARSAGLRETHIPAMQNWAGIEYPTDNPKYWVNICYSKFYRINVFAPALQP